MEMVDSYEKSKKMGEIGRSQLQKINQQILESNEKYRRQDELGSLKVLGGCSTSRQLTIIENRLFPVSSTKDLTPASKYSKNGMNLPVLKIQRALNHKSLYQQYCRQFHSVSPTQKHENRHKITDFGVQIGKISLVKKHSPQHQFEEFSTLQAPLPLSKPDLLDNQAKPLSQISSLPSLPPLNLKPLISDKHDYLITPSAGKASYRNLGHFKSSSGKPKPTKNTKRPKALIKDRSHLILDQNIEGLKLRFFEESQRNSQNNQFGAW